MDKLTIINPVAEARTEDPATALFEPAERLETLSGKTIGLYWNGKNNGQYALAETRSGIERRFPDTKFLEYTGGEGGVLRRATDEQLDAMAAECDAVVGTTADCGSCTSWLVRDMSEIERRGTPALCWTASEFREDASFSANIFGCPHIGIIEVPECFTSNSLEVIATMVDDAMDQVVGLLTVPPTCRYHGFQPLHSLEHERTLVHGRGPARVQRRDEPPIHRGPLVRRASAGSPDSREGRRHGGCLRTWLPTTSSASSSRASGSEPWRSSPPMP